MGHAGLFAGPPGSLSVAMVGGALGAFAMALARRARLVPTRKPPAVGATVNVAAIAADAEEEDGCATTTEPLTDDEGTSRCTRTRLGQC